MPELADVFARLFAHTPATVFSLLGLALVAGAGGLTYRAIRLMGGESAGGTIIRWHKRTTDDTVSYAPVVRFQAGAQGEFEVQSSTVFEDKEGDINVPVMMRYDPRNPERADIEGRHHPWRPMIALLVLAAGAFTVAWQAGGYEETAGAHDASEFAIP
ncbi:DUF3592 domain-containing protein [Altererythrobacter sp. MF3-039]|uniref:DUF3592 domain-containing protein n=1 Tax=Altererythrobacter sp. MF3-039 TaxID=3252901 RepID=UPI00390C687A